MEAVLAGVFALLAWRTYADSLLRAAAAREQLMEADLRAALDPSPTEAKPSVTEVHMLLAGHAIESLAKARIVAGHPSRRNADHLAADLKSHNLLDLLARAGITLTEDESYLIERPEVFVTRGGRYPIPVKLED